MSANLASGVAPDFSGNGLNLSPSIVLAYQKGGYVNFTSMSDLLRLDNALLDISGTEGYIDPAMRGLTLGGWFRPDEITPSAQSLVSKWGDAASRSYNLSLSGSVMNLSISDDGTAYTTSVGGSVSASQWHFLVGRFVPGATQAVWIDGAKFEQVTTRASAYNSAAALHICSNGETTPKVMPGDVARVFLCAMALPDAWVGDLFTFSRTEFGV